MSKRSVAYIAPEEPSFLRKLKAQAGYKEGPTVDTKREELPTYDPNESPLHDDEPQIVVLREGDLTAEEVTAERAKIEKEKEETPADLSARVIFKPRAKSAPETASEALPEGANKRTATAGCDNRKSKSKRSKQKVVLSFADDEEDGPDN